MRRTLYRRLSRARSLVVVQGGKQRRIQRAFERGQRAASANDDDDGLMCWARAQEDEPAFSPHFLARILQLELSRPLASQAFFSSYLAHPTACLLTCCRSQPEMECGEASWRHDSASDAVKSVKERLGEGPHLVSAMIVSSDDQSRTRLKVHERQYSGDLTIEWEQRRSRYQVVVVYKCHYLLLVMSRCHCGT